MKSFRSAVPVLLVGLSLIATACGGPSVDATAAGDSDPSAGTPGASASPDDVPATTDPAADAPADAVPDEAAEDTTQPDPASDPAADPASDPDRTPDPVAAPGTPAETEGDCSASGARIVPRPSPELPAEVVALRDFLLDAALRCDEQLLRTAMDESDQFSHTFGGSDDAIGDWWELEEAGEAPFLRMAQVLGTTPALAEGGEVYVWPQVATGTAETTTDAAWAELTWLDDPAAEAAAAGGYLDWRLGISADGQWRFFVAGD